MIKTMLAYLFILSLVLFYIYYGIRLIDNFKTNTENCYIFNFIYIIRFYNYKLSISQYILGSFKC